MIKDYFRMAFKNLTHRKLRTFLTLIGIFVGIAAVVGLISLTQGFNNYLNQQFKTLGADKISISPSGSAFGSSDNVVNSLTKSDVEVVAKSNGVKEASYESFKTGKVEWGKNDQTFAAVVTYPLDQQRNLIEEVMVMKIIEGRALKSGDKYRAVLGYQYANSKNFDKNLHPGDKFTINGVSFRVVGIDGKIGDEPDDQGVYIPESAFKELFNTTDQVGTIVARVQDGRLPSDVVKNVEKDLRRKHGVKVGEEDFEVTTFEDLIKSFLTVLNIVSVVLIGIAAISLVVGGIGIMNTMYTSVLERTREIGIMKAIGARNSDILTIFLIESGLLGLTGGAIGVILGLAMSKAIEYIGTATLGTELLKAAVPLWLVLGALAFAFILGSVFGLVPAIRASKMNPVDALRTE